MSTNSKSLGYCLFRNVHLKKCMTIKHQFGKHRVTAKWSSFILKVESKILHFYIHVKGILSELQIKLEGAYRKVYQLLNLPISTRFSFQQIDEHS